MATVTDGAEGRTDFSVGIDTRDVQTQANARIGTRGSRLEGALAIDLRSGVR